VREGGRRGGHTWRVLVAGTGPGGGRRWSATPSRRRRQERKGERGDELGGRNAKGNERGGIPAFSSSAGPHGSRRGRVECRRCCSLRLWREEKKTGGTVLGRDGNGYPIPEYPTGFTRYNRGYGMISLPVGTLMGKILYPTGRRVRVRVYP